VTLRHPDLIGAVAIALIATAVIVGAVTSPDPGFGVVRPATFPVFIGVLMVVSAIWLAWETQSRAASAAGEAFDRRPLVASALLTAAFLLAFVPLGFVLSATPYLVAESRILGSRAPLRDAVAAVLFVLAVYVLFVRFLTVDLPNGPLPF
jgi:putative tricarboxylic transport membrane protein